MHRKTLIGVHTALFFGSLLATSGLLLTGNDRLAATAGGVAISSLCVWLFVSRRWPDIGALSLVAITNFAEIDAAITAGTAVIPACFTVLVLPAVLLPWGRMMAVAIALSWATVIAVSIPGLLSPGSLPLDVVAIHAATLPIVGGAVVWFAYTVDRSRRKLVVARDEAQRTNRAKTELLARVSHELRTPLSAMLGYLELTHQSLHGRDKARAYVTTATRNSRHLLSIVDELLDISRAENRSVVPSMQRVELEPLLDGVLDIATMRARNRPLTVRHTFAPEGIPAQLDSDAKSLRQILINLLSNAVKFTQEGEVCLHGELRGMGNTRVLCLAVRDTGPGIASADRERIFEPFFRTEDVNTIAGTGLGLSVSQRLAESLGGRLTLSESELGVGSTFMLTLPAPAKPDEERIHELQAKPGEAPREGEEQVDLLGFRCLVVDDNPDLVELLRVTLASHGAEVILAENGAVALERAGNVDLVLMDLDMPVLDGLTAIRILRERGFGGVITALTAHAMEDDRRICLAAGADHYLPKPITTKQILEHVQTFVPEVRRLRPTSPFEQQVATLRAKYAKRLPDIINGLVAAVANRGADAERLAHNLAGTAGTYGFHEIGATARELYEALQRDDSSKYDSLTQLLRSLVDQERKPRPSLMLME